MKKYLPSLFFFLCISVLSIAQPLSVKLLPRAVESFPALQSFAWAEFDSHIFFLGGRIDGLHRRQPFAAFDAAGRPQSVWMLNEADNTLVSRNLDELPASLREQIQSTNMEFIQNDSLLYLFGGYGYSEQAQDHITFPYLTKVNLPLLLNALNNNIPLNSAFSQVSDERLAITGGRAGKIGNRYFIYGGHRFEGRYNPMNGPSFVQTYTNALRSFEIQQNGPIPELADYSEQIDTAKFHRRDFNLVPQIFPGGNYAYTAYSGVFRTDFDLPYTNAITTNIGDTYEETGFNQYLNHYHCAVVPVFINENDRMHNLFFGGMAQYFPDTNGSLVQDNSVPFVSTIADVQRDASGALTETALEISMNGLKGAGAEFIPNPALSLSEHGVIVLSTLPQDSVLLGWIAGGIEADLPSVFWVNDGTQSRASGNLMEVWLHGDAPAPAIPIENSLSLRAFPCPMNDHVYLTMQLLKASDVGLRILTISGKSVYRKRFRNEQAGEFKHTIKIDDALLPGVYILEVETQSGIQTMKLIVSE